jgi:hypothetical protein
MARSFHFNTEVSGNNLAKQLAEAMALNRDSLWFVFRVLVAAAVDSYDRSDECFVIGRIF